MEISTSRYRLRIAYEYTAWRLLKTVKKRKLRQLYTVRKYLGAGYMYTSRKMLPQQREIGNEEKTTGPADR